MSARFQLNTAKVVAIFALPIGALCAYVAYTEFLAWSRVAAIQDDAQRHLAMHRLTTMTAVMVVCLVAALAAIFLVIRNVWNTEFGESQLTRPGLFRRTSLQWSEVTEVKRHESGTIRLKGAHGSLIIPVGYYTNPRLVSAYIAERLKSLSPVRE